MPNISCTEFNRLLAAAVESHQSTDSAELREHAAGCAECRAFWLDALLVDCAVARWKSVVPAAELADRVLFRLADQATVVSSPAAASCTTPFDSTASVSDSLHSTVLPRARRRLVRGAVTVLVASCAAVCVSLFIAGPPDVLKQGARPITANQPTGVRPTTPRPLIQAAAIPSDTAPALPKGAEPRPSATPADPAPVDLLVRDAGHAYLNLASEAADAVTAATVLVSPPESPAVPAAPNVNDEPWVDEVQRELTPVTRQLSQAFEFLIQAVPAQRAPAT